jgi:hypothetical protein
MSSALPADLAGTFGVDGCTSVANATANGMPLHFYIGELGATRYSAGCLNRATAAHVTPAYTYGYWGVCGPNAAPARRRDAAAWGHQQALLAVDAWTRNPLVAGRTIFADVESGFSGWGAPASRAEHVSLLDAFLQTIAQAGFTPGVYVNNAEKAAWFPDGYVAAVPFVYWVAGGKSAGAMPAPCHPLDTLHPVARAWSDAVQQETFGGMQAALWQYWLSGMGCGGDFNYSPQPRNTLFTPQHAR